MGWASTVVMENGPSWQRLANERCAALERMQNRCGTGVLSDDAFIAQQIGKAKNAVIKLRGARYVLHVDSSFQDLPNYRSL